MLKPNALVSRTIRFEPPYERERVERMLGELTVELDGGLRARFDPANRRSAAYAGILDELSRRRLPVYLELDAGSSAVIRLLIPRVSRIAAVREAEGGSLDVELEYSQARHVLERQVPDFAEMERLLVDAASSHQVLLLTEEDDHRIFDVRLPGAGPDVPVPPPAAPRRPTGWLRALLGRLCRWLCWPWWRGCISMQRAAQAFTAMSATSCDPLTVPPPCIPFLYPDDGCWGRAHQMRRLMVAGGLNPRKIWIQGQLKANTRNNPNCYVRWNWHVAPTLCVRRWWFFWLQTMVIDPSLFSMPVPLAAWKGVQGDPSATLTDSDGSIFYLWGNVTDPTYTQTDQVLASYRLQLQLRSLQIGPPPYANCP